MAEILEIIMIVAFGLSWPNNIITSLKNKSTKGKNIIFMILIDIGYVAGIAGKLIGGSYKWYVLFFYILNLTMVTIDMMLYFHYKKREKGDGNG